MRKWMLACFVGFVSFLAFAEGMVVVKSVAAQQRYPWNGLVDIVVSLECSVDDIDTVECLFVATNSATGAVVPITTVTQNGSDSASGTAWTRRYIWNATNDVGVVKIDDLALTVDVKSIGVQLWEDGPYWAECNVGASKPEEYGYYFWWGDTVGYKREGGTWTDGYYYSCVTWVSSTGTRMSGSLFYDCPTCWMSNSQLRSEGYIDSTGNLVPERDAATAHLGAPWRMPTDAEFAALVSNCDTTWTMRGGVYGRLVTGRGAYASKSIFLPAAGVGSDSDLYDAGLHGLYWSSTPSTPYSDYSSSAWGLYLDSGAFYRYYYIDRNGGLSVRPVRGFAK